VLVCTGRDCLDDGSLNALKRFKRLKASCDLDLKIGARPCMGPCGRGPNVDARLNGKPINSPGTGVRFWTNCEDDRACATVLEAAGLPVQADSYAAAPPKPLVERGAKFVRGYWKQINNALFAFGLVGVDYLYQEQPDVADEYSRYIVAFGVAWQLCIRAAQGRMYVRASERPNPRRRVGPAHLGPAEEGLDDEDGQGRQYVLHVSRLHVDGGRGPVGHVLVR